MRRHSDEWHSQPAAPARDNPLLALRAGTLRLWIEPLAFRRQFPHLLGRLEARP